jgi:membrane protein insertase Oxa1/YidC/SpoIIIJ
VQQKQVSARNSGGPVMPQQQILLKVMPAFFGVISIGFPAALVVYWVTSSVYRIGLQGYITKSLYSAEDSPGKQASAAAAEARTMRDKDKNGDKGGDKGRAGSSGRTGGARPTPPDDDAGGNGKPTAGKYQPSSKKKKRKKR